MVTRNALTVPGELFVECSWDFERGIVDDCFGDLRPDVAGSSRKILHLPNGWEGYLTKSISNFGVRLWFNDPEGRFGELGRSCGHSASFSATGNLLLERLLFLPQSNWLCTICLLQ